MSKIRLNVLLYGFFGLGPINNSVYLDTVESLKFMGYTFQLMAYADIFVLFSHKTATQFLSKRMTVPNKLKCS